MTLQDDMMGPWRVPPGCQFDPQPEIPDEVMDDDEVQRLLLAREILTKQVKSQRKVRAIQKAVDLLTKQNEALRRELAGEPQPKGTL